VATIFYFFSTFSINFISTYVLTCRLCQQSPCFGYNFSKLSDTKHFPFHRSLFFLSHGQFRQGFHNWMPTELPLCPFILWILFWKSLFTIYEQEVPFILQKTLPGRASPESKTITAYPEQNLNTLY
jgi:hypothetical protein